PDTGAIERPVVWREENGRTFVRIQLDPGDSVSVVFRESSANYDPLKSVTRDGKPDLSSKIVFAPDRKLSLAAATNGSYELVSVWPNRLIGDEQLPDDCQWRGTGDEYGVPLVCWPQWLLEGKPSPTGRLTFATWKHWHRNSPLLESGLIGPVTIHVLEQHQL